MTVYLVGAGPGDPGLLTARALELIAGADVIVHDRLIPVTALDGARPDAERYYVGKEGGGPSVSQEDIGGLLREHGAAGRSVVRLKGGDPFVFGRGGEEALALRQAGVRFEVVPGVSALSAVPGSLGIPITHRGLSAQVTLVSGHSASGEALDYDQLARAPGTLIVFMGLSQLAAIAAGLLAAGRDPATPAAVISRGTHTDAETVHGGLDEIAALGAALASPALLVVGEVVALAALIGEHADALSLSGG